jgi:hypothetical protein
MQRIAVPVPVPYFGKVWVPLPTPVLAPLPDPDLFRFYNKIFVQNLAFSMLEAAMFSRKFASNF